MIKLSAELSTKTTLFEADNIIQDLLTNFPPWQKNYIELIRKKDFYLLTISKNPDQTVQDHVHNLDGTII